MKNLLKTVMLLAALFVIIPGCSGGSTITPGDDTTPPSWDYTTGIAGITPDDTTVTISWGAATDTEPPVWDTTVGLASIDENGNEVTLHWGQFPRHQHPELSALISSLRLRFLIQHITHTINQIAVESTISLVRLTRLPGNFCRNSVHPRFGVMLVIILTICLILTGITSRSVMLTVIYH